MASGLTSTWRVTAMRGIVALCLALLELAHLPTTSVFRADLFGAYALTDGMLCVLAVSIVGWSRWSAEPLLAGAAGVAVGISLLSWPRVSPMALAWEMAIWGIVIGLVALDSGYTLYRDMPRLWRDVELGGGVRAPRRVVTQYGLLLAGGIALAFALAILALASSGAAVWLTLVALFAATFGYLRLRVGLALGLLALTAAPSAVPELEGGHA